MYEFVLIIWWFPIQLWVFISLGPTNETNGFWLNHASNFLQGGENITNSSQIMQLKNKISGICTKSILADVFFRRKFEALLNEFFLKRNKFSNFISSIQTFSNSNSFKQTSLSGTNYPSSDIFFKIHKSSLGIIILMHVIYF